MGPEPPVTRMSRNRVEELESTVAELESTVEGLTGELVDAKERIRDLEAQLEPAPADGSTFETPPEVAPEDEAGGASEPVENRKPGGEADKNEGSETEDEPAYDDIIVA